MGKFRENVAAIEEMLKKFMDDSFTKLRSAEGAFDLLQKFRSMQSHEVPTVIHPHDQLAFLDPRSPPLGSCACRQARSSWSARRLTSSRSMRKSSLTSITSSRLTATTLLS